MPFFISFLAGVIFYSSFQYFPFSTIFILLLYLLYFSVSKRFLLLSILVIGVVAGMAFTFVRQESANVAEHIRERVAVTGMFKSYPARATSGTYRQSFRIHSAFDAENGEYIDLLREQDIFLLSDNEFEAGAEYGMIIKFVKSKVRLNPGERIEGEIHARILDIYSSETAVKKSLDAKVQDYRNRINKYIEQNLSKDSGSFVMAITTGHRAGMDDDLKEAFNAVGLAHILSISGTHFGLFSVLLFGLFRMLIKFLPYRVLQRLTIFLSPSQAAALLCFPFMLAYLGLSGYSIPAVRSFIMIGLFLAGLVIGRKGFWLNSLVLAAFIMVLWDPRAIFNLSFQLSFIAVIFIGFSLKKEDKEETEEKNKRDFLKYPKNVLLITISASLGTAPLVAYSFHYFSVISPFTNLFLGPVIGFVLIPLSVFSSFIYLVTGHFISTPVLSAVSDASISCVKFLATFPFADIKISSFPPVLMIFFYSGCLLYFLVHRKKYFLLISFLPILVYVLILLNEKSELAVTFLDVGQGDSAVVELPDEKTIIIDTGRTGREAASFLHYRGIESIDALVLSHIHPDHTGGLYRLINKFNVKAIWHSERLILPDIPAGIDQRSFRRGDVIEGKGYQSYVLHPYPEFYTFFGDGYDDANNDSLVLKLESSHGSFLFAGDVEEEAEKNLVHLGKWLKSDILKVPHHGGRTSTYEPFFEMVSPNVSVISAGRENPFGHPHQETLAALNDSKIFRTDLDGAIKISESERGIEVKTFEDFTLKKTRSFRGEIKNIMRLFRTW
ncbi:MAG: DNA internalization-related competence protein ComEC/Rec2 [Nitrospirota bacterium]